MMLVPRAADAIRSERIVWDFDAGTQEQGVYQY
jgi:hypothetical protein